MCLRYIIEREDAQPQLEQQVRSKRNEDPERELVLQTASELQESWWLHGQGRKERVEAYNWYDFVLDRLGRGDYVEETGEVELGVDRGYVSVFDRGWNGGGSKLTDEASNARDMVCCARVMIAVCGGSS